MASGQTGRYGLNQWQPEDKVLREEFNTDNTKVDGALAGLADQMGSKVEQAELEGVKTQLATKASQADLNTLKNQVATKAEQSTVNSLSATMTAELAKKYGTDNPYIKIGTYIGTGAGACPVTVGFCPSYVLIIPVYTNFSDSLQFSLLQGIQPIQVTVRQGGETLAQTGILQFSSTGFTVPADQAVNFNRTRVTYYYVAFR